MGDHANAVCGYAIDVVGGESLVGDDSALPQVGPLRLRVFFFPLCSFDVCESGSPRLQPQDRRVEPCCFIALKRRGLSMRGGVSSTRRIDFDEGLARQKYIM